MIKTLSKEKTSSFIFFHSKFNSLFIFSITIFCQTCKEKSLFHDISISIDHSSSISISFIRLKVKYFISVTSDKSIISHLLLMKNSLSSQKIFSKA